MNERIWGIIGGVALLLALLSPLVLGNSKKVERLFEDAETLYEHSNYEGAIEKYKKALKESNKPGAKTEHIDKDFTTLANLRIALCYYHLAEKTQDVNYYHDALAYITKVWQNAYVAKHQEELIHLWAETLYKIEDFEKAKTKFAWLIEKFPNNRWMAKALYTIGNINYQQQNYEEAKSTFQKLIDEFPNSEFKIEGERRIAEIEQLFDVATKQSIENKMHSEVSDEPALIPPQPDLESQVKVMYDEASNLRQQGRVHDAIQRYTDLITQFPENYQYITDAYIGIAEIYLEAEDYVNARASYEEAMYTTNDGEQKIEIYKKYQLTYLVPVYANDGNARANSGDAQFFIQATRLRKEGKFLEAAKLYEQLTNRNISAEDTAKAIYWTGYCYHKEGLTTPILFGKSVNAFKRLIDDYGESSYTIEAYYGLVLAYSDWARTPGYKSKWKLVITIVEEAIAKYTNSHDFRDRGWLSRMRELKELAIQELKPRSNPNPDTTPIPVIDPDSVSKPLSIKERHVDQGYIHFGRGELKNATKKARQALKDDSNYQRAHELLSEIKETYYGRGWTFFDEDQYDKAIDAFKNAINIEWQFKEAHCHLGVIYIKKKAYAEAIKVLKEAINIDKSFKEAHFNLSLAYLKLGRFKEAKNAANAALRIDPNYEPANRLIDYIAD
ncbi:MAG: tetratricopeptide repeat protein [Candidatus Poribacteria bacterium]|nr:tetratricopeptide repeat protein [Candidatus Poribacteria bacterium]